MIEQEIADLPREDFSKLAAWVEQRRDQLEDDEDRRDVEEATAVLNESGARVSWMEIKRKHGLK